jgi:hypothetical protein
LGQLSFRGVDELAACPTVLVERQVPVEIGLCIVDLGPVAIAIGDRFVELGLVWTRIDFGEKITLLHRLSLCESDLDELAGDLAAYDHVVISDHRAHTAQIDLDIALEHRTGNDRHGGRRDACQTWRSLTKISGGQCGAARADHAGKYNEP